MLSYWREPPILRVCTDAYRGDFEDVKRAVRKIRRHGGDLTVERAPCVGLPEDGYVWLVGWTPGVFPPGVVGLTFTVSNGLGMQNAVVFVDLNFGQRTLEHELLHAMGVGHSSTFGHVMYPDTAGAGDSWSGVDLR